MPFQPQDFGPYQLGDMIAKTAMSEVFEGHLSGRSVAVKRLLPEHRQDPSFYAYFRQEQRLSNLLQHPNLVPAVDTGAIEGIPFIALDYVESPRLVDVLCQAAKKNRRPSIPLVLHVATGVASALAHLHMARDGRETPLDLVHMDIAPHNIFTGRDGVVQLFDLGIARSTLFRQQDLAFHGRVAYWAPEQIMRREVPDARIDVFALGTVLWELITVQPLFRAGSPLKTAQRVIHAPVQDPRGIRTDCPEVLATAVLRALQRDRTKRYSDAQELLSDLRRARLRLGEFPDPQILGEEIDALLRP